MEEIRKALTQISKKVMLSNRFSVELHQPTMLKQTKDFKEFNYFVRNTGLPSITTNLHEVKYNNKKYWVPISSDIDSINLTLFDTKELVFNKIFRQWVQEATQFESNKALEWYPDDIVGSMRFRLNETTFDIKGVYPISIGDTQVSYDSEEILNFSVTFKIQKMVQN